MVLYKMEQKVNYSAEKLIDLVRQKPHLWNRKYPGYCNNQLREDTWVSIADAFVEPDLDALTCKSRWQSLRAGRTKSLHRTFKNAYLQPGAPVRPYRYTAMLSFLGEYQLPNWEKLAAKYQKKCSILDATRDSDRYKEKQHERSTSTSSEPTTQEIFLPENDDNLEQNEAKRKKVKSRTLQKQLLKSTSPKPKELYFFPKDDHMEPDNSELQEVESSQQSNDAIDKRQVSQRELWCKSLAYRLGKMEPETASLLMLKIQTLVHEVEFGELS